MLSFAVKPQQLSNWCFKQWLFVCFSIHMNHFSKFSFFIIILFGENVEATFSLVIFHDIQLSMLFFHYIISFLLRMEICVSQLWWWHLVFNSVMIMVSGFDKSFFQFPFIVIIIIFQSNKTLANCEEGESEYNDCGFSFPSVFLMIKDIVSIKSNYKVLFMFMALKVYFIFFLIFPYSTSLLMSSIWRQFVRIFPPLVPTHILCSMYQAPILTKYPQKNKYMLKDNI